MGPQYGPLIWNPIPIIYTIDKMGAIEGSMVHPTVLIWLSRALIWPCIPVKGALGLLDNP